MRGWEVAGEPSVSVSVSSLLTLKEDLAGHSRGLADTADLIGLWVGDKRSTGKGEVLEVVGDLGEHRTRLLNLTRDEETQELLQNAPDDEIVVRVAFGRNEYDYAASALNIVLRTSDFVKFGIRSSDATRTLKLEPNTRGAMVREVANLAKTKGLISDGYNSRSHPELFQSSTTLGFNPSLRFGNNVVSRYQGRALLNELRRHGPYQLSAGGRKIRIGFMNTADSLGDILFFQLSAELEGFGYRAELSSAVQPSDLSRANIERSVSQLISEGARIVLAVLPDDVGEEDEDWGVYHSFKSTAIGRGIPSQAVYKSTVKQQYAFSNIALGILAKTGSIPYTLAEPLPYADVVVGLDIARERKRDLAGSLNAAAVARIYLGDGQLLRYVIQDSPIEGETIPLRAMEGESGP